MTPLERTPEKGSRVGEIILPFITGDGIGPEIFPAARRVLDSAVSAAYCNERRLTWLEVLAGEKAFQLTGSYLPDDTLHAFEQHQVGLKGPLSTPVGQGHRSLNVALRQAFDLYACVRPVRWFEGITAPTTHPEQLDVVLFRENTEDLYTGIEFAPGSEGQQALLTLLSERFPVEYARLRFPVESAFSLKPISAPGSQRLVRAALRFALENGRKRLTLVHKGNIMKATEGGFCTWGYEVIESEFSSYAYTQRQYESTCQTWGKQIGNDEKNTALSSGAVWVDDCIADAAFERALTHPVDLDVIATPNLNGDYLSDALAAQVGGLGIAPGGNINYDTGAAIFEATHGTAPAIAGHGTANPTSLILSGALLLRHIGWVEAASKVEQAVVAAFAHRIFTPDLSPQDAAAPPALSTQAFGAVLCDLVSNL